MKSEMSEFAKTVLAQKYLHDGETWEDLTHRVTKNVFKSVGAHKDLVSQVQQFIFARKFMPGGRYLYAAGLPYHMVCNCLMMRADDSREGWADLMYRNSMSLMSGGGVGTDYSSIRAEGKPIRKTRGTASGPIALMQMSNEVARGIQQGGNRRAAQWAGLKWSHADIMKFVELKNWIPEVRAMKAKDFNFPATMDGTNISVQLDDEFFKSFDEDKHTHHTQAHMVYWATIERMLKTGEPGFSIDTGKNRKETLRNACTELCSEDDSDICNLGSINLARIESLEEMKTVVEVATAFLLAGTVYSDVPFAKVDTVRTKNRRLGLGLMGVHEWLLRHDKKYGIDSDLDEYLKIYATSDDAAAKYAKEWDLSCPVKTRAIAPTGTISIIGETSSGLEPIFCAAYKRRYLKGSNWHFQYVLDPTAKILAEAGINPDDIEDAYVLAEDVERRLAFQAHVQKYVDHAISSTINLPQWGSELNNTANVQKFGKLLIKYLPHLRGITVYPDGARSGQPLTPIKFSTAAKHLGETFLEAGDVCEITGKGGSCGG